MFRPRDEVQVVLALVDRRGSRDRGGGARGCPLRRVGKQQHQHDQHKHQQHGRHGSGCRRSPEGNDTPRLLQRSDRRGLQPCDDCCRDGDAEGSGRHRGRSLRACHGRGAEGQRDGHCRPNPDRACKIRVLHGPDRRQVQRGNEGGGQQSSRRISVSPRTASSGRKRSPRSTRQSPTERSPRRARRRPRQPRRRPRLRQRRPRRRPPPPSSRLSPDIPGAGCESHTGYHRTKRSHESSPEHCENDSTMPAFGSTSDGGAGIRTQGALARPTVFKTAPFDRSGTPPFGERSARRGRVRSVRVRAHAHARDDSRRSRPRARTARRDPSLAPGQHRLPRHGATLHARPVEDRRDHALGRRGRDARVGRGGTRPG